MKKQTKYRYLYVLQGNYDYGWDDLMEFDSDSTIKDRKDMLKTYRENEKQYSHRIVERRELNNN